MPMPLLMAVINMDAMLCLPSYCCWLPILITGTRGVEVSRPSLSRIITSLRPLYVHSDDFSSAAQLLALRDAWETPARYTARVSSGATAAGPGRAKNNGLVHRLVDRDTSS